jgi:hypothetical protein
MHHKLSMPATATATAAAATAASARYRRHIQCRGLELLMLLLLLLLVPSQGHQPNDCRRSGEIIILKRAGGSLGGSSQANYYCSRCRTHLLLSIGPWAWAQTTALPESRPRSLPPDNNNNNNNNKNKI